MAANERVGQTPRSGGVAVRPGVASLESRADGKGIVSEKE